MADRAELKEKLKSDPGFKSELRERIKSALGMRVPAAQPVSYNFDSYMLQDVEVRVRVAHAVARMPHARPASRWLAAALRPAHHARLPAAPPHPPTQPGQLRLLEVDERLVLPTNTLVRVLVTASDVLHSWAVPALGVKIDAIPGRLNQIWLSINREGVFYGQCSEL